MVVIPRTAVPSDNIGFRPSGDRPNKAAQARQLAEDENTAHTWPTQKIEYHSTEEAGARRLGWLCQSMPGMSRMVAPVSPISSTATRWHISSGHIRSAAPI